MSKEKSICWRGTDGDVQPMKCFYEGEFGYPNYCNDENGKEEKMYQNTHFLDIKDAWMSIIKSVKAGVSLSGRDVKRAKIEYEKCQADAGEAVLQYQLVKDNENNPFSFEL